MEKIKEMTRSKNNARLLVAFMTRIILFFLQIQHNQ